mgnify:CR=1 FL=1
MLPTGPASACGEDVHCPACGEDVPDGKFCASCGDLLASGGAGGRLRLGTYAAASRERVLRPWPTTALFPQLPRRARTIYRTGLILLLVAAVGFAVLGWRLPVMAATVVGLPVLLASYLREIAIRRNVPARYLVLAALVAVGLGVGWQVVSGPFVEDAYYAEMGGQLSTGQLLACGVAIPIAYAIVLVAPAALVRVFDRSSGESLDGFTIGALGATLVNAAATATFLAPQVAVGMGARNQPIASLLAEVMVEGVAWPLGSAAAGGLFGLALWFTPRDNVSHSYRRGFVLPAALLGAVAFSIAMGLVDVASIPMSVYVALQLPIALAALLAMRIGITDALLHEAPGGTVDGSVLCAECDHVVARRQFCSNCGVAFRSAARTPRIATYRHALDPVTGGLGIAAAATVLVAAMLAPAPADYVCPPDCGHPPLGHPVEINPRYSGDGGAFSVAYPGEGSAYEVALDPPGMNGVQARYVGGDTGLLNLFGEPARGRTPKQVVGDVMKSKFPEARVEYEIPNASVGYEPGYGAFADVFSRGTRMRVVVMAAIRHDYALIATAAGPYHEFSQDYGTGHPSAANLEVAMDMGKYVNSFRWFGDKRVRPK